MKQTMIKKALAIVGLLLLLAGVMMSTSQTSASPENPLLWPYNQPTSISFNEADVYAAWAEWRDNKITSNNAGGNGRLRVMGGVNNSSSVSEGQGYGILFASIFDEQNIVDGLWLFTADHLNAQGLMDWHIGNPGQRLGTGAATDGDEDIALGLLNACIKVQQGAWPASPAGINYCAEATAMINAIYQYEVDHPGSSPPAGLPNNQGNELLPGDEWDLTEDYPNGIINLSYFSPGYYTVFGKFTNNQAAWEAVNDRNYEMTDIVQSKPGNCSGLVPNWNNYNGDAQLVSWQPNNYSWWSYDAARFAWRIAVDKAWYGRPEANETMNEIGSFFSSVGMNNIGEHSMNGVRTGSGPWPFFVANAASAIWAAPNLSPVNCGAATGSLQETPQSAYNRVLSTKDGPQDYYGNAWRILAMLVMTGNFPNIYELAEGTPPNTPPPPTNTPDVPTATATTPSGGSSDCVITYEIPNEFHHGFQAQVAITNNSATPIDGYTLTWTHQPGQVVQSAWNVTLDQVGNDVTATNPAGTWMGMIDAHGGTQYFGFIGTLEDNITAVIPTDFVLNGVVCNGDDPQPTATTTSVPPTATTAPPTVTSVPPTVTSAPPTATATTPPTQTAVPPTATTVPPTATTQPVSSCSVDYVVANDWGTGFTANVTITNNSNAVINGWTLTYDFPGNQTITNAWNGTATQSGPSVEVTDAGWNRTISANGGTASFGFNANYSGANDVPDNFTLNGTPCQ